MFARIFRTPQAPTPEEWERRENAQSLREIPLEDFPEGPARREAIRRAEAGEEIYGYRPAFLPEHVIWHYRGTRDLATDCRFTPAEWARREGLALTDGEAR